MKAEQMHDYLFERFDEAPPAELKARVYALIRASQDYVPRLTPVEIAVLISRASDAIKRRVA